jgi:hypothetical protein
MSIQNIKQEMIRHEFTRLLLAGPEESAASAVFLAENGLWMPAVELACRWRVLPLFHERLDQAGQHPGPAEAAVLRQARAAAAAQSALLTRAGAELLGRLNAHGIDAVAIKGLGHMAALGLTPARRMLSDIDLLIDGRQLPAAFDALCQWGYTPQIPGKLEEWLGLLGKRMYPTHGYIVFRDAHSNEFDVHWGLSGAVAAACTARRIIERSREFPVAGATVRAAAPSDLMMLTAHHAVREGFRPRSVVKDLCDLVCWWECAGEGWLVEESVQVALAAGLGRPQLALWQILLDFNPHSSAVRGADELKARLSQVERTRAGRLAAAFHMQLRDGTAGAVALGLSLPSLSAAFRFLRGRFLARRMGAQFRPPSRPTLPGGQRLLSITRCLRHLTPGRIRLWRELVRERRALIAADRCRRRGGGEPAVGQEEGGP